MNWKNRDCISINDFSRADFDFLLEQAKKMEALPGDQKLQLLKGKVVASLFFEPSTRTKNSFSTAIQKLGASIVGFESVESTSDKKGESLHDTIKMYDGYTDAIVMRHPKDGSARFAAQVAAVPVINGGDGKNQHPTQTLLDLYTILKSQGSIVGLNVAFVGDLKYGRTPHSLAVALKHFGCKQFFVAPPALAMPQSVKEQVGAFSEHQKIEEVIKDIDVLYMTRIQRERFPDEKEYEKVKNVYRLTATMLQGVKQNLRVMHPLPRVNEIASDVDRTPHALYFEQAHNGVPMREALLNAILGEPL